MRVAVVGGGGAMGRKAVETIAGFEEVTELLVLDRDTDRLDVLAEHLGSRIRTVVFDAERDALADHLVDVDVVLNALGPFTVFGQAVLTAAIETECDYVDINDDWEPTLDALELDGRARAAGITALVGMGLSPGVSNVLAVRAAAELDEVSELYTGWMVSGTETEPGGRRPSAAVMHLVHECVGKVQAVEGGAIVLVRPLERLDFRYPGIGEVEVRTIGHPEPVTLPRRFPGLRRCANLMVGPAWWFAHLEQVMGEVDRGILDQRQAALMVEAGFDPPAGDARKYARTPRVWGLAIGVREGRPTRAAVGLLRWPEGRMAGATSIPGAVALRMMLRGQIQQHGVLTPEDVVPFDALMAALDAHYTLPDLSWPLYDVVVEAVDDDA